MARLISLFGFLLLIAGQAPLLADLPLARLLTVFPPGGQGGARFEITLTGSDLDEVAQLYFSDPGITARPKTNDTTGAQEPNKFIVAIGTNVLPGICEARAIGRFGISNPRAFVVSDLAEVAAATTNTSMGTATTVSVNSVINGHSEANAFAFYKFPAKKGQRILIGCQAGEIDSRMEAAVILSDATGKELQRSRGEELLDFAVKSDGEYYLKVYDFLFRGGGEYFYRLAVTTRPHIDYVFPPSGLAGTKGRYLLYGRNLPGSTAAPGMSIDGKPLEQLEVEIELPRESKAPNRFGRRLRPGDNTLDAFEYRLKTGQGISNPVLIGFAPGPVIPEAQANDDPAHAQSISVPCEFVGQFFPARDKDWVSFEARKGDRFLVEVFSQRFGLATAPLVLVQRVTKNDKGEEQVSDVKEFYDTEPNVGGVDYKTILRDPSGRLEIEADGVYRIAVRDSFNTFKNDPRLIYRLSIRKESPDFHLVAAPQAPPPANKDSREALVWISLLCRGETIPIKVMAFRSADFKEEILLEPENLPAGVSCPPTKIEKEKTSTTLLLTATEDAKTWVGPLKIVGKSKSGPTEIVREAAGASVTWTVNDYNNEAVPSRLTRDFMLAVSGVESAPLSIEAAENKTWEITESSKIKIPLKITRRMEFNATLKLKAAGIGALEKLKEIEVDGKATNATLEIDLKENRVPPGIHTFYLQTQTSGKYRNNPEAAKTAEDALKQVEQLVKDLTAETKKAPELKQAAAKAVTDSAAKSKAASETAIAAAKTAEETATQAKAAREAVAAAKAAVEAKPDDPTLIQARDAATKAAEEAESKYKKALEAKLAAQQTAAQLAAKSKADEEAKIAVEKHETEIAAKLKEAEKKKEVAATRARETAKTAEPRDVNITVYSSPITLKITPALAASAK